MPLGAWFYFSSNSKSISVRGSPFEREASTYSIGTRSLVIIVPNAIIPPAPSPQTARAMMKLCMLSARPHHAVAAAKIAIVTTYGGFLPIVW
jgi:hypothetical protein